MSTPNQTTFVPSVSTIAPGKFRPEVRVIHSGIEEDVFFGTQISATEAEARSLAVSLLDAAEDLMRFRQRR
jgi:hypothetical protein